MLRLAIILFVGAVALQQRLSDSDVDRAIQAGVSQKHRDLISACAATPYVMGDVSKDPAGGRTVGSYPITGFAGHLYSTGTYAVTVSTNVGRIALLAATANRLQKTFTLADVGDDLRGPAIFVHVEPDKPRPRSSTPSRSSRSPIPQRCCVHCRSSQRRWSGAGWPART